MFQPLYPFEIVYVSRHPESEGNEREKKARKQGRKKFNLHGADRTQRITRLGRRQGFSEGVEIGSLPKAQRPTLFVSSHAVRTVQGVDEVILGSGLHGATRVEHFGFRDAKRGKRSAYVSSHVYFQSHPRQLAERETDGRLLFKFPHGEADIEMVEGRAANALRDVADKYAGEHKVLFLSLHHTSVRAVLARLLGLDIDEYEELCKKNVPNGSYCVLVRDKATGVLRLQEEFHVPKLLKRKEYRRLRKERTRRMEAVKYGK
jgi:broad specificity phosphatase PhoE